MSDDLEERLEDHALLSKAERNALFEEVKVEIERLQDAKRAALKLADERAKEANGLRQQLASANTRISKLQGGAERYWEGRWRDGDAQLAKAKLALENIATWRKVNMVGEFEPGLRDIIRSMTDCAANALDSLTDEQGTKTHREWWDKECPFCGGEGHYATSDGKLNAAFYCDSCHINKDI